MMMRRSYRTLIVIAVFCTFVLLYVGLVQTPYCLTGTHSNGSIAWRQWERYGLLLKPKVFKTERYYSTGAKSMESNLETGIYSYWSPDGTSITAAEYFELFQKEGGEVRKDVDSIRPLERLGRYLVFWK